MKSDATHLANCRVALCPKISTEYYFSRFYVFFHIFSTFIGVVVYAAWLETSRKSEDLSATQLEAIELLHDDTHSIFYVIWGDVQMYVFSYVCMYVHG